VPAGLNEGDEYHLAIVTSGTRDATSPDIGDYNDFVRAQAELDGALTKGFGIDWFAIASTTLSDDETGQTIASVDAKDNAVASAPVYLLDGTLVAHPSAALYLVVASPLDTDQFGAYYGGLVWTGSLDGVADVDFALGSFDEYSVVGVASGTSNYPLHWEFHDVMPKGLEYPLYALSEKLTAPAAVVPEPSSAILWLTLASGTLALSYARRRSKSTRHARSEALGVGNRVRANHAPRCSGTCQPARAGK
jgi:hypothetical protein